MSEKKRDYSFIKAINPANLNLWQRMLTSIEEILDYSVSLKNAKENAKELREAVELEIETNTAVNRPRLKAGAC